MKQNLLLTNESSDGTKTDKYNLQRFLDAQSHYYEQALQEVQNGYKSSHWIWFIFPQLATLGHSYNAKFYGISGYDEAEASETPCAWFSIDDYHQGSADTYRYECRQHLWRD